MLHLSRKYLLDLKYFLLNEVVIVVSKHPKSDIRFERVLGGGCAVTCC